MRKLLWFLPLSLLLSCGLNKNDKQLDYLDINLNYPASMWEKTCLKIDNPLNEIIEVVKR